MIRMKAENPPPMLRFVKLIPKLLPRHTRNEKATGLSAQPGCSRQRRAYAAVSFWTPLPRRASSRSLSMSVKRHPKLRLATIVAILVVAGYLLAFFVYRDSRCWGD